MQRHHRRRGGQVQLGQQDAIGRLHLGARLLVAGELPYPRLGVDDADDRRRDGRRLVRRQRFQSIQDRPRLRDAGRLEDDDGRRLSVTSAIAAHSSD